MRIEHQGIKNHPCMKSVAAAYGNLAECMKEQTVQLEMHMSKRTFFSFAEEIRTKHNMYHSALTKKHPYILSMRVNVDNDLKRGMWHMTVIIPNNREVVS